MLGKPGLPETGQAQVPGPGLAVPSLSNVPSPVEYLPMITAFLKLNKQTNKKTPKQLDFMLFTCMLWKLKLMSVAYGLGFRGCQVYDFCSHQCGRSAVLPPLPQVLAYGAQAGLELSILLLTSYCGYRHLRRHSPRSISTGQASCSGCHLPVITMGSSAGLLGS